MGRWRLPELLTRMRRLLDTKEIDAAFVTLDQIEDEWGAISDALEKESLDANRLQDVLSDLARGVW
jgi:hypothetical protein